VIPGNATGLTRDVSACGVYLWIKGQAFNAGDRIRFAVQIDRPAGTMRLVCRGDVVRTEHFSCARGWQ